MREYDRIGYQIPNENRKSMIVNMREEKIFTDFKQNIGPRWQRVLGKVISNILNAFDYDIERPSVIEIMSLGDLKTLIATNEWSALWKLDKTSDKWERIYQLLRQLIIDADSTGWARLLINRPSMHSESLRTYENFAGYNIEIVDDYGGFMSDTEWPGLRLVDLILYDYAWNYRYKEADENWNLVNPSAGLDGLLFWLFLVSRYIHPDYLAYGFNRPESYLTNPWLSYRRLENYDDGTTGIVFTEPSLDSVIGTRMGWVKITPFFEKNTLENIRVIFSGRNFDGARPNFVCTSKPWKKTCDPKTVEFELTWFSQW
ncbi:MAG: hypothetical protein ACW98K_12705 [Candidatus Kariarchaeaceae archaeon]|jgi:hypothetical protein